MTAFHTIANLQYDIEKKLMDGFLAERDRVEQEVEKEAEQGNLL